MTNKQLLYFLIFILMPFNLFAQKEFEIVLNQNVVIRYDDKIVNVALLQTDKKIRINDDKYYYWYNANDIKVTKGGYSGKLLNGTYVEYYLNKNLKEKGQFKNGVKVGEWKSWYPDGEYKEISHWKNGKLNGKVKMYGEKGVLVKESSNKNGVLNGKTYVYMNDGSIESISYKNGQPVLKKPKKKILKNIFKKKEKPAKKEEANPSPKKVAKKVLVSPQ